MNNPPKLPPYKIAFVIDNQVAEILYAETRLAAILLSDPTIVEVTELLDADPHAVHNGDVYNPETGEFSPAPIEE